MTRMFKSVTRTWNPVVGCQHYCSYCWASGLAETKLKHMERYKDGFDKPKQIPKELRKRFKKDDFVFVTDMGDLFGEFIPKDWILSVLAAIRRSPYAIFLLQTKNPIRYLEFLDVLPPNVMLGATIESNRDYGVSKAPSPRERYEAMSAIEWGMKFLSIEPIMDFDFEEFSMWIKEIKPGIVELGTDNYGNHLPEPSWDKIELLLSMLKRICTVKEKEGLSRLRDWDGEVK